MSIWRTPKPVIAQVHGWCVGGGSDMALCADLIIASEDAQIGTPYSRIWGCYLSGMWLYRLGLTRAKEHALTGRPLSGREAAEVELITRAVPFERLEEEVATQAQQLASLPSSQLAAMKLIVNQAYENMGLSAIADAGPDPRRADAEHSGRPRVHRPGQRGRRTGGDERARRAVRRLQHGRPGPPSGPGARDRDLTRTSPKRAAAGC